MPLRGRGPLSSQWLGIRASEHPDLSRDLETTPAEQVAAFSMGGTSLSSGHHPSTPPVWGGACSFLRRQFPLSQMGVCPGSPFHASQPSHVDSHQKFLRSGAQSHPETTSGLSGLQCRFPCAESGSHMPPRLKTTNLNSATPSLNTLFYRQPLMTVTRGFLPAQLESLA